jgi:hypothetical protein
MTSDHNIATMTQDTVVAFDKSVAFFIPMVTLLMSMPMMWHEEHLWNVSVLQREHLSNVCFQYVIVLTGCGSLCGQ